MITTFKATAKRGARKAARVLLPSPAYRWLDGMVGGGQDRVPPVGTVKFGDLRRTSPISREYGYDRGRPIDRYYIENFLRSKGHLITGHVLEIGERTYTEAYGQNVAQSDMLHVNEGIEGTTYVDDLTDGETLPSNTFDCVILTQTLHLIYDMNSALKTIYRILKPGGVLLATVPGITQISDTDWNDTWYWALSTNSARRLTHDVFPPDAVEIEAFGNVLSATAFLQGLADSELTTAELDVNDREYQVTIAICARTASAGLKAEMVDRWDYAGKEQFAYDEDTSYRSGMAFLDGHGKIEDWGCGTAYASRFVKKSEYVGVDGSDSQYVTIKADLQTYTSKTDSLFMRHVLEHNWGWRSILANAVASFRDRMVLVVFTPFGPSESRIGVNDGIPDLTLNREEVLSYFQGLDVREEAIASKTEYGQETIFYIERKSSAGGDEAASKTR